MFTIGFMISFIATEMMEVAITNLTANVVPPHLYRSRFNPSFMLTFTGLVGRFIGCMLLPVIDYLSVTNEYRQLIVNMYTPMIIVTILMLITSGIIMAKQKELNTNIQIIYANTNHN